MPNSKPPGSPIRVAPEFSGLGRLASILKPTAATGRQDRNKPSTHDTAWNVFGVGIVWQTSAENAARLSGTSLGDWLTETINEAARAEGIPLQPRNG